MDNENLRKLQLRELDILKDVIDVMDKIGVKYYLSAGTLLGAVRHKGFIPWDDDIDIMLTRQDFELFLASAHKYLPQYYRILHHTQHYSSEIQEDMERQLANTVLVIQVHDTRYSVRRPFYSHEHIQNIWIDIAALDEVPDNYFMEMWFKIRLSFLHLLLKIYRLEFKEEDYISRTTLGRLSLALNSKLHFAKLVKPLKVIKKMDDILKRNDNGYKRYINFMGEYKFKEVLPRDFLGKKDLYMDFENIPMRIPENYDSYLKAIYGDYMKLPPEEKRICKHILEVD